MFFINNISQVITNRFTEMKYNLAIHNILRKSKTGKYDYFKKKEKNYIFEWASL